MEATTGTPVGHGFVVLLDSAGQEAARTLTDAHGRFAIYAPQPGRYRVRSERIGYRAFVSPAFALERGQRLVQRLSVESLGLALAPVEVTGRSRCRPRPDREQGTAAVWEEMRKALAAAAWIERRSGYRYRAVNQLRDSDLAGRVLSEIADTVDQFAHEAYRSVPATQLARRGYIVRDDDSTDYYAPDAAVLQDSTFLSRHCFWVVRRGIPEGRQLGLAFEPVPGTRLSDVEGTLWLDEGSAELRTLQYRYTRLPDQVRDRRIGGAVDFMRLPSGAWIVHRWLIRMPRLGRELVQTPIGPAQQIIKLVGFREESGEIVEIRTSDGSVVFPL